MEYLLVRLDANLEGEQKWGRNLGERIERARARLPPEEPNNFASWDPGTLLADLRVAIDTVVVPSAGAKVPERKACTLARRGKVGAARGF